MVNYVQRCSARITYTIHLYIASSLFASLSLLLSFSICIMFYCTSQSLFFFLALYNILHFYNKLTKKLSSPPFPSLINRQSLCILMFFFVTKKRERGDSASCAFSRKQSCWRNCKKWHLLISLIKLTAACLRRFRVANIFHIFQA